MVVDGQIYHIFIILRSIWWVICCISCLQSKTFKMTKWDSFQIKQMVRLNVPNLLFPLSSLGHCQVLPWYRCLHQLLHTIDLQSITFFNVLSYFYLSFWSLNAECGIFVDEFYVVDLLLYNFSSFFLTYRKILNVFIWYVWVCSDSNSRWW